MVESYGTDGFGNVKTIQNGSATRTFQYDALNRITSETASSGQLTYTYDDMGNRSSLSDSGAVPSAPQVSRVSPPIRRRISLQLTQTMGFLRNIRTIQTV
ncbi:hypothetical protein D3H35_03120 [Cohnella faecalis]|uniref:RHS repeat protein n=1 Tax=Cohnella faecalis TaxID=2315694 RepID=A0A398CV24_9BACL|nr:hypothetical protein D3H35_03120 [Cohnella faecalis]